MNFSNFSSIFFIFLQFSLYFFIFLNISSYFLSNFTLKSLKQILFLYPDAYILQWLKSIKKKNELDLLMKIPLNENYIKSSFSDSRRKIFKDLLLQRISIFHKEFLKEKNLFSEEKTLENARIWHFQFKIDEIPQIPEGNLPVKPIYESHCQSLNEFLKGNDVKNKDFLKILQETAKKTPERNMGIISNKLGLSQKLMEKVR